MPTVAWRARDADVRSRRQPTAADRGNASIKGRRAALAKRMHAPQLCAATSRRRSASASYGNVTAWCWMRSTQALERTRHSQTATRPHEPLSVGHRCALDRALSTACCCESRRSWRSPCGRTRYGLLEAKVVAVSATSRKVSHAMLRRVRQQMRTTERDDRSSKVHVRPARSTGAGRQRSLATVAETARLCGYAEAAKHVTSRSYKSSIQFCGAGKVAGSCSQGGTLTRTRQRTQAVHTGRVNDHLGATKVGDVDRYVAGYDVRYEVTSATPH